MPRFRIIALLHFILFSHSASFAQAYCLFDEDVKQIYSDILQLKLEKAQNSLGSKSDTSNNLAYVLLANEIDFYRLFISEEKNDYEDKKIKKNERLHRLEKSGLPLSWNRFLQAEIHLQWALVHLKQEDEFKAFQSIRKAIRLLENNIIEYPDFMYSYKSLGILHTLMSTIPEGFQWAAWLLGIHGKLHTGKMELEKFIRYAESAQDLFLKESYAAMSFIISFLENKPEEAYKYWKQKSVQQHPGCLETLVHCKMAMKAGLNDEAFSVLKSLDDEQKRKLPLLFLLQGMTAMQRLDPDADVYFHKFLKYHKGQAYIKEAYQKLAWIALLKAQTAMYHFYISNCLTRGNEFYDEDKQAKFEAQSRNIPDYILLRGRLLFDGGYYDRAFDLLRNLKSEYYLNGNRKLEYAYRMGRILQMKKEWLAAMEYYKDVYRFDPDHKSHLTVNALLQNGVIHEALNNREESMKYFKQVLKSEPDLYKRSLHQKAKAGLARLK